MLTIIPWKREGNHASFYYGSNGYDYGFVKHPIQADFPDCIGNIMKKINSNVSEKCKVNSVLCNLYESGKNSLGWHADDESVLGKIPHIFSLSLGATRLFQLRDKSGRILAASLPSGSVLYMGGDTQQYWEHRLARQTNITEPRINLTFRNMKYWQYN